VVVSLFPKLFLEQVANLAKLRGNTLFLNILRREGSNNVRKWKSCHQERERVSNVPDRTSRGKKIEQKVSQGSTSQGGKRQKKSFVLGRKTAHKIKKIK
jgi:hypothetical protein